MSKESTTDFLKNTWIEDKKAMKDDNYMYDTLEEAANHYVLLGHLFRMFSEDIFKNCRDYELKTDMCLTRVVNEASCNVERIIPKKEFCSANRMNPKGKFYGYYAINYGGKNRDDRIKTAVKEIRAENADEVSSCEFSASKKLKLAKFAPDIGIRLTLEEEELREDLNKIKQYYGIHGGTKGKMEIAQIYTFNIMLQTMVNGDFFCPVEGSDTEKDFHYAPFRLIADYLSRNGYDGILYQSSVDPKGYCVAIFQPNYVKAIETSILCNIQVSHILND